MAYETLAFVYGEAVDESPYQRRLDFSNRHLLQGTQQIPEVAYSTGTLATDLTKNGCDMTTLDLSEEMLMTVSERTFKEEVPVQFIRGNMLDLSEVEQRQAITRFSDSLCYMANRQGVQQVLDGVYQALKKERAFIFDVHSTYEIDSALPEYSYHYQTEEFVFLWDSYAGEKEHSIEHLLTSFVREQGTDEHFVRYDELHQERTYSLDNYLRMLESAGFMNVKVYAGLTDEAPTETSERWFFICQGG